MKIVLTASDLQNFQNYPISINEPNYKDCFNNKNNQNLDPRCNKTFGTEISAISKVFPLEFYKGWVKILVVVHG